MALQTRRELLTRVAPRDELVNVPEFEAEAERASCPPTLFRLLAGGDRAAFERITFRPRMMVNCLDLNLSLDLCGIPLFAPMLVGPVADQRRFHPDGELATVRGAAAGKAAVVVSSRSSHPLPAIAAAAPTTPLLFQAFAGDGATKVRAQAIEAAARRLQGDPGHGGRARRGRPPSVAARLERRGRAARRRLDAGDRQGRDDGRRRHRRRRPRRPRPGRVQLRPVRPPRDSCLRSTPSPRSSKAVGPQVPVLLDGGVRRGSDVMKALASGARAVLVARPVMWGLAAYGADGVQTVVELLQTELARVMGCCGTPTLGTITASHVRVHAAVPPPAV